MALNQQDTFNELVNEAQRLRDENTRLARELEEIRGALRAVGIFRSDEAGDDGSEWCVTLEPHGEDAAGSLEDALHRTMRAAYNDGAAAPRPKP